MQSFRTISAIAAMAVVAPGMAVADQRPKACADIRCAARDASAQAGDVMAQCRRLVREKGPVSRFRSSGRELSDTELRACNRFTIQTQPPRN